VRPLAIRIALFTASPIVGLVLAEVIFRLFSFEFDPMLKVEFGWPRPEILEKLYLADPEVFWVPKNYRERLDAMHSGRPDIVFLGDSCTEFGSYPRWFRERIEEEHPGLELAVEKLGVAGWTSYQGLQQLKRDVLPLRPRLVSFYFGWNDHWVGFGLDDRSVHAMRSDGLPIVGGLRVAQLFHRLRLAWLADRRLERPRRVSPEDFRNNLRSMAGLTREMGAVPLVLTAPTSHEFGREPRYLAERWLTDLRDLVPLHQRYVSIAREVAAEDDIPLCDLAADFAALPQADLTHRYFKRDGMHLVRAGYEKLAEFLYACFEREPELRGIWTPAVSAGG
jgi:lysophospholipase L1-like esterase